MRVFLAFAVLFCLVVYPGIALSGSDEICCTWVNTSYKSGQPPQKINFHNDGSFATYGIENSTDAIARGTFQIVKKWADSNENSWYQIIMNDPVNGKKFILAKAAKDGKKLEFVCLPDSFPTDISASIDSYCTYLRASIE